MDPGKQRVDQSKLSSWVFLKFGCVRVKLSSSDFDVVSNMDSIS